jgi:hypothetical protein
MVRNLPTLEPSAGSTRWRAATVALALATGAAGAIVAALCTALVVESYLDLVHAGDYKDRGIFAVLVAFALGAPGGLLAGLWLVARAKAPGRAVLRRTLAAFASLAAVLIFAAAAAFHLTSPREAEARVLEFEIRLPAGMAVPPNGPTGSSYAIDRIDVSLRYGNEEHSGSFPADWLGRDGERPVIRGDVPLHTHTNASAVLLYLPGQPIRQFAVDLPPEPPVADQFGPWQRVERIRERGEPTVRPAEPGDTTELRFRIARARR